jgi:hypothetical protein
MAAARNLTRSAPRLGVVTKTESTIRLVQIADILGVTHQRTSVIVRQPGFPAPLGWEGRSSFWDRREVVAWARKLFGARSPGDSRQSAIETRAAIPGLDLASGRDRTRSR